MNSFVEKSFKSGITRPARSLQNSFPRDKTVKFAGRSCAGATSACCNMVLTQCEMGDLRTALSALKKLMLSLKCLHTRPRVRLKHDIATHLDEETDALS